MRKKPFCKTHCAKKLIKSKEASSEYHCSVVTPHLQEATRQKTTGVTKHYALEVKRRKADNKEDNRKTYAKIYKNCGHNWSSN